MYVPDDTIVAISSALGAGGRGIIRLSGPEAISIADSIFEFDDARTPAASRGTRPAASLKDASPWIWLSGRCRLTESITCPAVVYLFHQPHSYTGQNLVELHLPGSVALLEMILQTILLNGARMAQPGEFTARAFFNGRMDLTEAEAVAEVISARSDSQLRAAERLLEGALHRTCAQLTERLADILSLVESDIDFSDQQIEFTEPDQLHRQIIAVRNNLERLVHESLSWEQLSHLPRVVVSGPVNAGKSSLLNTLVGFDRGIVSNIAGTTRDLLTTALPLAHGECLLIDTAGLGPVADPLAGQTQQLARKAAATCDLLLWVVDITSETIEADLAQMPPGENRCPTILVLNKIDLAADPTAAVTSLKAILPRRAASCIISVSALRGDNLDALKERLEYCLHAELPDAGGDALALTLRQRQALLATQLALEHAIQLLSLPAATQPELVALELRDALDHLGSVSGQVVTEDLLERIFSRFCIGK